jgi:hypothetical protein
VRRGLAVEGRGEIPLPAVQLDVLLDGAPAPQLGDPQEVLPCPRCGIPCIGPNPATTSVTPMCT